MADTVEDRVALLADPEFHFGKLAEDLRKQLDKVQEAYNHCQWYGLVGDFYTGPDRVLTHLPDSVVLTKTVRSRY